jgi:hypothetical protein
LAYTVQQIFFYPKRNPDTRFSNNFSFGPWHTVKDFSNMYSYSRRYSTNFVVPQIFFKSCINIERNIALSRNFAKIFISKSLCEKKNVLFCLFVYLKYLLYCKMFLICLFKIKQNLFSQKKLKNFHAFFIQNLWLVNFIHQILGPATVSYYARLSRFDWVLMGLSWRV